MSATRTCGACERTSQNKHWDCPPRMADGRLFTDYRPRCDINLEHSAPMAGTHEYRQHLIRNAADVIAAHRQSAFKAAYSGPCVQPFDKGTMLPEADAFKCDAVSCRRVSVSKDGLGTGRDYGTLPEHKAAVDKFLAEQAQHQARLRDGANCCGCGGDGGYYPVPGLNLVPQQEGARWAVPSGATPLSGGDPSVRRD